MRFSIQLKLQVSFFLFFTLQILLMAKQITIPASSIVKYFQKLFCAAVKQKAATVSFL